MTGVLVLARPWWRVAGSALRPAVLLALVAGYVAVLGASGTQIGVVTGLLVVFAGWTVVLSLSALVAQSVGAAPQVGPAGVALRTRSWRRRLVTVPWDEVTLVWIGPVGGHRLLFLTADPRGAHADEWDPRHKRFTGRFRPLMVLLPRSVTDEQVAAAVRGCSGGAVELADRGPEPVREHPALVWPRPYRWAVAVVVLLFGLPAGLGLAPLWNQPWWPGVTAVGALPDPCTVFAGGGRLGVSEPRTVQDDARLRRCDFKVPQGDLSVRFELHRALFGSSTDAAHDSAESLSGSLGGPAELVVGVGDEAWLAGNPQGTTTLIDRGVVRLVARRANVVLVILYGGEEEPDTARAAVIGAAGAALGALTVR